jgi:hypothetical protein
MTPAAAPNQAAQNAGGQLASAYCDYEQRCNNIGEAKKYGSREHCMTVMGNEAAKKVNHCVKGIDQEDLRECLTDIAGEGCDNAVEGMMSSKECSMDDMCL